MTKLEPCMGRLVVARADADDKTAGGIVIPDDSKEKLNRGEVLAVGPGFYLESGDQLPAPCEEGDVIVFAPHAGLDVKVGTEEYLVIDHTDVVGIIREE